MVRRRRESNVYLYFQHRDRSMCYLGPEQYKVTFDSEALGLRGVWDPRRLVDYVRNAIRSIGWERPLEALRLIEELEGELAKLKERLRCKAEEEALE